KEADVAPAKSKTQSQKSHIPAVPPKSASSGQATGQGKKLTAKQAMQQGIKPHLGGPASGVKKAAASTTAPKAAQKTAPGVAGKRNLPTHGAAGGGAVMKPPVNGDLSGKIEDLLNALTEFPFQVDVGGADGSEQLGGGINGTVVDNALRSALGSIPANPAQLTAALNSRFIGHEFESRTIYDWKPVPVA